MVYSLSGHEDARTKSGRRTPAGGQTRLGNS